MSKYITLWDQFWFKSGNLFQLSLMRLFIGVAMLTMYIPRQFQLDFYSEDSLIGKEIYRNIFDSFFFPIFDWHFWPDSKNFIFHSIFIMLLTFFTLGILNRFSTFLLWVLHMGFFHRNISVAFGADYISALFLLYLSFTHHSEFFTIKSLLKKNYTKKSMDMPTSIFYRLIQFQISIIYVYTGIEKLKGSSWWDGTALWLVLANPQVTNMDFTFLRHIPLFFVFFSFITIIFEIYFPVMIYMKKTRYLWLFIGLLFHFGITFMMGLYQFSMVMLSTYFLFIETDKIKKVISFVSK